MNISAAKLKKSSTKIGKILKVLTNTTRLMILCFMLEQARSVGELAALLNIRSSTASQHLSILRKMDLVATQRVGQTVWYSLKNDEIVAILQTLYGLYCKPATTPKKGR